MQMKPKYAYTWLCALLYTIWCLNAILFTPLYILALIYWQPWQKLPLPLSEMEYMWLDEQSFQQVSF